MTSQSSTPDLDDGQEAVVSENHDARLVVTAGPGCGKTFTAARRISAIAGSLESELPVLALSFSRAATLAIESACWNAGCRTGVRFATIDSWAFTYLRENGALNPEGGFDRTISGTLEQLSSVADATPVFGHVLIDEAQDLSGRRRDLALELLRRSAGGWTVLGDLAQKIFDFEREPSRAAVGGARGAVNTARKRSEGERSAKRSVPRMDLPDGPTRRALECVPESARDQVRMAVVASLSFPTRGSLATVHEDELAIEAGESTSYSDVEDELSLLEAVLSDSRVKPMQLLVDHRSKTKDLVNLRSHGEPLRQSVVPGDLTELWDSFVDQEPAGRLNMTVEPPIDELSPKMRNWARESGRSTAILVQNRALLLQLVRHVASLNDPVPFDVMTLRDDDVIAPWVATLAAARTEEDVLDLLPDSLDKDIVLRFLNRDCMRGGSFDPLALAHICGGPRVPEILKQRPSTGLWLSTVHRVKGLEFDRVVVASTKRSDGADTESLYRSRVLFVALTRASEELRISEIKGTSGFAYRGYGQRQRLVEMQRFGQVEKPVGMEIRTTDICLRKPPAKGELRLVRDGRKDVKRYLVSDAHLSDEYGYTTDGFAERIEEVLGISPHVMDGLVSSGFRTISPPVGWRHYWTKDDQVDPVLAVAPILSGVARVREGA